MGIKITVHADGFAELERRLAEACTRAEAALAEQVLRDTAPYIPARTLSLTNRARAVGNMVIYPGPYARYLYYGKVMVDPETGSPWARKGATKVIEKPERELRISKEVHPKAQTHWLDGAKAQNLEKWRRVAGKAVEKYGTK